MHAWTHFLGFADTKEALVHHVYDCEIDTVYSPLCLCRGVISAEQSEIALFNVLIRI